VDSSGCTRFQLSKLLEVLYSNFAITVILERRKLSFGASERLITNAMEWVVFSNQSVSLIKLDELTSIVDQESLTSKNLRFGHHFQLHLLNYPSTHTGPSVQYNISKCCIVKDVIHKDVDMVTKLVQSRA
jgi:hypothetical protein